jgi:hypothetical protein
VNTCPICRERLDPAAGTTHPNCATWAAPDEDTDVVLLKHQLMEMILWAERESPRTKQKEIGPSEIGAICDRRIGYRVAEVPACNIEADPWPAVVGTGLHMWLDKAINAWGVAHNSQRWRTETSLPISDFVTGTGDLFDTETGTVIDHKGAGNEVMRQVRNDGPKPEHRVQVHLYGLGYQRLGHVVNKVAVVYYPRAGWLRDCYVWVDDFKPDVAYAALNRLGDIAQDIVKHDVFANPHRWNLVPATSSNACGLCDWYNPGRDPNQGADNKGCPGK